MLDSASLIEALAKCGPNPNSLSDFLGRPSLEIKREVSQLVTRDGLTVFPAVYSEGLGLRKVFLMLENAKISYDVAKGFLHPIMSIFRGDLEEKLFSVIAFADRTLEQEIRRLSEVLEPTFSLVGEIPETRKFIRDPHCYDFGRHRWLCEDKVEMKPGAKLSSPDQEDVWAVTQIQANPSLNMKVIPHRWHVRKVVIGFMYVLGKTSLVVQALTKEDMSYDVPEIIWTARVQDFYLSEMHVDKEGLEKVMEKIRPVSVKIIVSPKSPRFALGYTIPYEVFRNGSWSYPKIKITVGTSST
ncbi:hypothetical protein MetMK1DRAFT_00012720 [Metallosphaera yellowstonensis MK1]|uniref:Uncharacterized protein n=1 Tax=Metallosphaera yellowstonensis MK1 TaxID=671065 RepID=H2C3E8_9CREN|nr:hypothetical protein [Metallosphaera yellowstonensis]EHP70769.1 hypothetical protein MetMK1DRAFT_00012720 [Metallosphaera yellowstonensis MK1]